MPFDKPRRQAEAEAEDVDPTFHSEGGRGRGSFSDCGLNRLMRLISTFHLPWTIIIGSGQHCAAICWIFWVDQSADCESESIHSSARTLTDAGLH